MKITWNWLAELVELEQSPSEVADRLAMAGLEVEAIEQRGAELRSVRVAEVVAVRAHPRADRLSVCDVRCGNEAPVTVVCGAPNVAAGLRVAYAPPGTRLPGGPEIGAADIRGVASAGMLCSEAELGIGPDCSGLLLLPGDAPLGESVGRFLGVDDVILDVSITPNRGDCLSVLGLAREIAALTGQRLKRVRINVSEARDQLPDLISVRIEDEERCARYVARVLSGVKIGPSPLAIQYRLRAVGIRPINNIVDVTNYVMIERGQPLHAFDYDRLPRHEIVVRQAGAGARFRTLDGQERQLEPDDLVISTGEEIVALAGVMGGANSEVTESTTQVLLESAWFAPAAIRRTAKRLGVRTESSMRFERSVDVDGAAAAADRAALWMARLSGGRMAGGRVDVYPRPPSGAPIALRLSRMDNLLGMSVPRAEVVGHLKALGMSVSAATRGIISVVPPSYRSDIEREIDLVEEVVRLVGYEKVPSTLPETALSGEPLPAIERVHREIKRSLMAQGLSEVVPSSFISPELNQAFPGWQPGRKAVSLQNPLAQDDSQMRLSLCSSLVRIVRHNQAQGADAVAIFLLNKVFWAADEACEAMHVAAAVCPSFAMRGVGTRGSVADFADVKGVIESVLDLLRLRDVRWRPAEDLPSFHPGKSARIMVQDTVIGIAGAVHPEIGERLDLADPCWLFELDLDRGLQYCPPRAVYEELPRFPAVRRDVAILANNSFAADEVVRFVRGWPAGAAWIEDVQVFDEYAGAPIPSGKKSLAFSIAYRATDRTLTDAEVNELHSRLILALTETLGVQPR
jgi:phenylalanyl-tRNA synthetase beta chain